jgi:hypothetical protein
LLDIASFGAMGHKPNRNEGEGSKSADKKYRDAATDYARHHDTLKRGASAERDVEKHRSEYERAEREGRSHSAGDLPDDITGRDFDRKR